MFLDEVGAGMDDEDVLSPVSKPEDPRKQLQNYLRTLPLAERKAYMNNLKGRPNYKQAISPVQHQGVDMFHPSQQGFVNYMGPVAQGNILQGAANDVMKAIAKENDSRVAQAREMRRMEHEREMERMRQETEQQKTNALLQRLEESRRAPMMTPYGPVMQFRNGAPM